MADITNPIIYSAALKALIVRKLNDPAFTHKNWGDEDLGNLRTTVRKHYRSEQLGRCSYCKKEISLTSVLNAHVEHIAPKSKHLKFIFEAKNLCVICADCNAIKRDQEVNTPPETLVKGRSVKAYPRSSGSFLIVHPHFDNWEEHIYQFGSFYVDRTDKGSFTIWACVLNRRIREFGWEAAFTDDATVSAAAKKYYEESEPLARARALAQLKKLLLIT